ncbi:hypothetical protein IFM89_020876 [Coptis chinensis]|uniref:Uncharacterized protein n=1 Tax=Coptis chinensis TaxID=261450 RepID=A0A835IWV9_9MAGN|nr:hypothetical protein IFM89_020876 [Coptis chinensis]
MMSTTTINPLNSSMKLFHQFQPLSLNNKIISLLTNKKPTYSSSSSSSLNAHHNLFSYFQPRSLLTNATSDGTTPQQSTSPSSSDIEAGSSSEECYVALFVRMLGLDNDPLDREHAIDALWKYSIGGNKCIDAIMEFRGCINLTLTLLKSDKSSACEAAAGLLRTISSVNLYRVSVAESGAIEEITALLSRSLTAEVKEQSICVLWNLSVDEKLRVKMANGDLLPILIKFLGDEEEMKAKFLKVNVEGSKVLRKVAKNVLLELAKDEFYRILVMEEGLVLVPLIGADAYKSLRPVSHSWPSFPDGTELERGSSTPSRYGASELLLGLNIQDKNFDFEEAKIKAIVGRTQQHFLARIGAIEMEEGRKPQPESSMSQQCTLLPWVDGVARLVLILELEDISAISRASLSISDACINEYMRMSFMAAGAVKHLVRLLNHTEENVKLAASHALERLSISNDVCNIVEAEGAVYHLVNTLKCKEIPENLLEKTVNILARILDPGKEMKLKFYDGPVNGSAKFLYGTGSANVAKALGENPDDVEGSKATARDYVLDSGVISRFVEIMKTSPNLQRKAASILEYIATIEPCMDELIAADIESGLVAVFHPRCSNDLENGRERQHQELSSLEAGLAISAASRLLTKLLDSEQFRVSINSSNLTQNLRKVLMSDIPLRNKDWVAACLIKLESSFGSQDPENPINKEVTLYETIPRLIDQIRASSSPEAQESAVVELNTLISTGIVDFTRAVADQGGIFPLVEVIEEGSKRAVEAGLAILFNLSMDAENHAAIIAAGAVPSLRRIVLSQGPQWMHALRLLRSLPTQ